jgi:hypothetical protein
MVGALTSRGAEWLSYRPSDLLMFSPAVYDRLFEAWNRQAGPVAIGASLAALALLAWRVSERARRHRADRPVDGPARAAAPTVLVIALGGLGLLWLLIAWGFHARLWAPVFSAAPAYALLFALQGVALAAVAMWTVRCARKGPALRSSGWSWAERGARPRVAAALTLSAVLLHPWVGWVAGHTDRPLEWFGLAPEPTVVVTLALWLVLRSPLSAWGRWAWRLLGVVPLAWGGLAALTLHTMERPIPAAWVAALTGLALATALAAPANAAPDDDVRR